MATEFDKLIAAIQKNPLLLGRIEPGVGYSTKSDSHGRVQIVIDYNNPFTVSITCEQYQQLCVVAIQEGARFMAYIKLNKVINYRQLCDIALEATNNVVLSYINISHFIEIYGEEEYRSFLTDVVRLNPLLLEQIQKKDQTAEMCAMAMEDDPTVIRFVKIPYELVYRYQVGESATRIESLINRIADQIIKKKSSIKCILLDNSISNTLWHQLIKKSTWCCAQIMECALEHNISRILKILFQNGKRVNWDLPFNMRPLEWMCRHGNPEIARMLIKLGATVNGSGRNDSTPLHYACEPGSNRATMVKMLLDAGANPTMKDSHGLTPLIRCVKSFDIDLGIFDLLVNAGALVNDMSNYGSALHYATERRLWPITKKLIQLGANYTLQRRSDSKTPIELAVEKCNWEGNEVPKDPDQIIKMAFKDNLTDVAEVLIQMGVPMDTLGENEITPLHFACHHHNIKLVKMLIESGVDVNVCTHLVGTPLLEACSNPCAKTAELVELLLKNGANHVDHDNHDNQQKLHGITPLATLCHRSDGDVAAIPLLIAAGADVNELLMKDGSALHIAVVNGHIRAVEELMKLGADPKLAREDGLTPLELAANKGNLEILKLLV
jgi:ankyrin repeat protein